MEIIYRANDDTEFTNKKDCINYEKKLAEDFDLSNVVMFDQKMRPLSTDTKNDVTYAIERVYYFSVETRKDYSKVVNLFRKFDMYDDFPEYNEKYEGEKTIYAYDCEYGNRDGWTNLSECLEAITKNIAQIEKYFSARDNNKNE